jgi:hypothetical protein
MTSIMNNKILDSIPMGLEGVTPYHIPNKGKGLLMNPPNNLNRLDEDDMLMDWNFPPI